MNSRLRYLWAGAIVLSALLFLKSEVKAQIWEPEGVNMPGLWNGWTNPPVNALALASYTQVPGGKLTKINSGIVRWQTTIKAAATGGDVIGGTYPFLFTSGPSGSPWQNTWKDVVVVMNTLQDYTYNGTNDDQITVVNGKWYTVNWKDNGYSPTRAIFMETSGDPVAISSVTQNPLPGLVAPGQTVTVTVTLSGTPSAEELFYLRYSNDGFTTSSLLPVVVTGSTGTAVIPAITGSVSYYIFSTTVSNPAADFDLYSIKINNNAGLNYTFTYNTAMVNVTFKVDMTLQTVSADGVHLVGDFQGWNTSSTPMTHVGNNIYSVTLPIQSGGYQEYKYLNGNSYAGEEIVPAACGTDNGSGGYNRFFVVPSADTVMNAICFSSCNACGALVPVTFKVDMSQQTVSPAGVHLAGDFQGWNPAGTQMILTSGSIYAVTINLEENTDHQYKFINGDTWDGAEVVPEACGVDNGSGGFNRMLTVSAGSPVLPAVCFAGCDPCGALLPVTFWLDMSEQNVSPDGVHIVGDFQGWNPGSTPMELISDEVYMITLTIPENTVYEFKYINGNTWDGAEIVPAECGVDNGSGGFNRVVNLGNMGLSLPEVCFSSCSDCPPPAEPINVTFRVDLSQQTVAAEGVHLVGDFQGWSTDSTLMNDSGNGIYTATVVLGANSIHQYKFINGSTWEGEEIVPAECGVDNGSGGYNRQIVVPGADTITMAVCFSSCEPCQVAADSSLITFRVDLKEHVTSADGVHIAGNFQGWDPASTAMTMIGDGIYEVNVLLAEGFAVEYKFINGIVWEDSEVVPEACGTEDGNGGFNRFFTVPVNDSITDPVCFNQCDICHVGTDEWLASGSRIGSPRPNPARDYFFIDYQMNLESQVEIQLLNLTGKSLFIEKFRLDAGTHSRKFELESYPQGVYVLKQIIRSGSNFETITSYLVK
jgi:1,4-alpha-glucan branching enzyme